MKIFENLELQDLDGEVWKDILGYEGLYQVSNYGRIKSFIKYRGTDERILKQIKMNTGYFCINLSKNIISKPKQVHRLVFETFIGKIPENYDVHHVNEDKENNNLYNFKLMSEKEHRSLHKKGENNPLFGKHHSIKTKMKMSKPRSEETKMKMSKSKKGENNPNFKISNQKIIDIQIDIESGDYAQTEMAKKHGVGQTTISRIKNNKLTIR